MVLEDMKTGETTPIDWCKDCFFTKGFTITTPDSQVRIYEDCAFEEWGKALREAEDKIIRDMIMSSAVPSQIPEEPA